MITPNFSTNQVGLNITNFKEERLYYQLLNVCET